MRREAILELRKFLEEAAKNYDGVSEIKLDIRKNLLDKILFDYYNGGDGKRFGVSKNVREALDFTNVNFDSFNASGFDFSKLYGVTLNVDRLYGKDLSSAILSGVTLCGSFDDCRVDETDFTESIGAKINPQTVYEKDFKNTNLCNVEIIGSFDSCKIEGAKFGGSVGAKIDPQTILERKLCGCAFKDVEFIGSFDGCEINGCDFTGSKGAGINPNKVGDLYFKNIKFTDVIFIDSFPGRTLSGINFEGSVGAIINSSNLNGIIEGCNFSSVTFVNDIVGYYIRGNFRKCSFKGSNNAVIDLDGIRSKVKIFEECILESVTFIGSFDGANIKGSNFTGTKNVVIDPSKVNYDEYTDFTDAFVYDIKKEEEEKQKIKELIASKFKKIPQM